MIKPKKLALGDTIALVAPSAGLGSRFPHRVDAAVHSLTQLGFRVVEFPTTRGSYEESSGTVEERVRDLHTAFANPSIQGIVCVIGGLSCNELVSRLDYDLIAHNPKVFCGYSDITSLHYAIAKIAKLITFYGPMAMTQFGEHPAPLEYTVDSFRKALMSAEPIGQVLPSTKWTDEVLDWGQKKDLERPRTLVPHEGYTWIKEGRSSGNIVGGCLYSLLQVKGTAWDLSYDNAILCIEVPEGQSFNTGTTLAYVDSQLMDLRNAGIFDSIQGLIVGRPFKYSDEEQRKFIDIIRKHTQDYNFPVLVNVNIGHTDPIITLPLGVKVTLDSYNNLFSIDEAGVRD